MRSLSPSLTFTWTRIVSPGTKEGMSFRVSADSTIFMMSGIANDLSVSPGVRAGCPHARIGWNRPRSAPTRCLAPLLPSGALLRQPGGLRRISYFAILGKLSSRARDRAGRPARFFSNQTGVFFILTGQNMSCSPHFFSRRRVRISIASESSTASARRSGRFSSVARRDSSLRQRRMFSKWPERRTSGTDIPRTSAGRV